MNLIAQRAALAPHWVWVIYTSVCLPAVLLAAIVETFWKCCFETLFDGLRGFRAAWVMTLTPMWLSVPAMFNRDTQLRARRRAIDIRRGYLTWPGFYTTSSKHA
jgi:hypothetical protein